MAFSSFDVDSSVLLHKLKHPLSLPVKLMRMSEKNSSDKVQFVEVDEGRDGQRLDNFLLARLKGVPKSRIYRLLRKGEIRVNKKRSKPDLRLVIGDIVRIAPIRMSEKVVSKASEEFGQILADAIVYEDKALIVVNKPSGLAVHGGSGISLGLIETLRQLRPECSFLELVHRLDRDTSGLVMVAKKRSMLVWLHAQLRGDGVDKRYLTLVEGVWSKRKTKVDAPLAKNHLQSGERMVRVSASGKQSLTRFAIVESFKECTLVEAKPVTGRTHQIRVHAQFAGHAIAGDPKYGSDTFAKTMRQFGLKRLFLHAWRLVVPLPNGECLTLEAPLSGQLRDVIDRLRVSG